MNFKIEPEFENLIPHQTDEQFTGLEKQIIKEGCRDPLVIWAGENILIDGHNRYKICLKHNIPYQTVTMQFDDDNAVKNWIKRNAFNRRNLAPEVIALYRGDIYNYEKQEQGAPTGNKNAGKIKDAKSAPLISTSKRLADEFGVSERTIKSDGKVAEAVELTF